MSPQAKLDLRQVLAPNWQNRTVPQHTRDPRGATTNRHQQSTNRHVQDRPRVAMKAKCCRHPPHAASSRDLMRSCGLRAVESPATVSSWADCDILASTGVPFFLPRERSLLQHDRSSSTRRPCARVDRTSSTSRPCARGTICQFCTRSTSAFAKTTT